MTAFTHDAYFSKSLAEADPDIFGGIQGELGRQKEQIELIASENIVSKAVLEAQGSVLTNKYAEGYPGRRYYGGCEYVDVTEELAALGSSPYFYVERGYGTDPAVRIIQAVLALLGGVLMLGGTLTATFLALSDSRPDLATMAAVGAPPRTRRGVAASYALVVGGIGALLGAPVGLIPGLAISRPLTRDYATGATSMEIPWLLVTVVVLGLPLLTAAVVGAAARGRLPLTARID